MSNMNNSGRILSVDDLFPPEGHRYITDERIEEMRQCALNADEVTLPSLVLMELICDWRNMTAEIERVAASGETPTEDAT